MAELTIDDVEKAVQKVIKAEREAFWIPAEKHWAHHNQMDKCITGMPEWEANHEVMTDLRGMGKTVRKTSLIVAVSTAVAWIFKILFLKG